MVLELLNRCFVEMSEIIVRHQGTIDKFMGDSIMVLFGHPGKEPGQDPVQRALACAVELQIAMDELNGYYRHNGLPELYLGIGLNTGPVLLGTLGSELYAAHTVIGEQVNLASRIQAFSLRGQVLISDGTYRMCGGYAQAGEPMEVFVKGRSERVRVRELLGIPSLRKEVPRQEVRRSPRVEVRLPFHYQLLQDKIVLPERFSAAILDIGYHGVLADVGARELPMHAEIKLDIELPLVDYRVREIYAKVVKAVPRDGRKLLGLEFTSVDAEANGKIQLFVQMLIQGSDSRKT